MQPVPSTKFTYKSDIPKPALSTTPSGILHATRPSPARSEQCFAFLADVAHAENAVSHLRKYGFAEANMAFVPYSSKENWARRYPHAAPHVECDEGGVVTGYPFYYHDASDAGSVPRAAGERFGGETSGEKSRRKAQRKGPKSLKNGELFDAERDELHKEIYSYFTWLERQLGEMEEADEGSLANRSGVDANGFRMLMAGMKSTFKACRKSNWNANISANASDRHQHQPSLPLLEQHLNLGEELHRRAVASRRRRHDRAANPPLRAAKWEPIDFEQMYSKLLQFKQQHGHADVPTTYKPDPALGTWVSGLRAKKKALDAKGIDLEKEALEDKPDPPPGQSQRYLDKDKVDRLEAIGFSWNRSAGHRANSKPWIETYYQLKQYHRSQGKWPSRSEQLGNFCKDQRKFYARKDPKFMLERAPLLDEIGFPWRVEGAVQRGVMEERVAWDKNIEKLTEFHKAHGHFNVPLPVSEEDNTEGDEGNSQDTYEAFKFYKWVLRLNTERKLYISGKKCKLSEGRIRQLTELGFDFHRMPKSLSGEASKEVGEKLDVPELPWRTRLHQLKTFYHDVGHLNIDHNYRHCGNLGGWAVEMSIMHKNWKEGREVPPDVVEKFDELTELGFKFNVFPKYDGNRSWDDHFQELVKYKEAHGHARIPIKYKADMRLGKWVQRLRNEYKKLGTGASKRGKFLTQERMERLDSLGFEWSAENNDQVAKKAKKA